MSAQQENGGPAFPQEDVRDGQGMTLRDYFAAKAMQGICAHIDTWGLDLSGIAVSAYEMADAALKARQS